MTMNPHSKPVIQSTSEATVTDQTDDSSQEQKEEEVIQEEVIDEIDPEGNGEGVEEDEGGDDEQPNIQELLLQTMNSINSRLAYLESRPAQQQAPTPPKEQPIEVPDTFVNISRDDMDTLIADPSKLVEEINKGMKSMYSNLFENFKQYIKSQMPNELDQIITRRDIQKEREDTFWNNNPHLLQGVQPGSVGYVERKNMIARIAQRIATEHPDWQYEQLAAETSSTASAALGIAGRALSKAPLQKIPHTPVRTIRKVTMAKAPKSGKETRETPPVKSKQAIDVEQTLTRGKGYRQ